jgi:hypothetical protein
MAMAETTQTPTATSVQTTLDPMEFNTPQQKILGRSAQCGWRMKTPFLAGHFLHIFLVYHSVMIVSGWSTKMVSLIWLWGSLPPGSSHPMAPVSYFQGRSTAATFFITSNVVNFLVSAK